MNLETVQVHIFSAKRHLQRFEMCESITDPVPGKGWYWFKDQKHQGEIGDICEAAPNAAERRSSFLVQREWSNHLSRCV